MKRIGNLWDHLTSIENLLLAFRKARRGKRSTPAVQRFEFDLEYELTRLRAELCERRYRPGGYRRFIIRDPKTREISAAPFRDRVIHHAFCNVVEPIFERRFIHDSYACRKGKGTHAAVRRYRRFARSHRYVLKCDVAKFFPSVDQQILADLLARKIKDARVLELARCIIASAAGPSYDPGYFPGDDLFTTIERRCGLPIGNQTSQFFANVYLDPLDHFVTGVLRFRGYVRYVDDFVLLDDDRHRLADARERIEEFLLSLRLRLHPGKRSVSRTADGLPFLGYRVWPDHVTLTKQGMLRFRRRLRWYQKAYARGRLSAVDLRQRICSLLGHAIQADTYRWRSRVLSRTVFSRACGQHRVSCAAVRGTTTPGTACPRIGTGTRPTTGTTTTVSGWPAPRPAGRGGEAGIARSPD